MDFSFPKHLHYDPEHHVWCLVESDQKIRLGIDPLGISSLGELAYLSLNPLESKIRKGHSLLVGSEGSAISQKRGLHDAAFSNLGVDVEQHVLSRCQ